MADWPEVPLSQVAVVNPKEPPLGADAPFVTMADVDEWGQWARTSGPRGGRSGARARGGDTLMARITPCLENGKIAKVPPELDRVGGSTEFIVLRASDGLLPDFLFLWTASPSTHQAAVGLMTGTTGRQRVTGKDIATLPIAVPSLPEQRRIVDLISAIDAQIEAERAAGEGAKACLSSALTEHVGSVQGRESSVRDLCSHVVGGIWGSEAGTDEVDVLALGPRIYAPGTPGFTVAGSPTRSYATRQVEGRLLRDGDIVLERSGGSPDQPVGRVVIADGSEGQCVPTDFQRLLRPDSDQVLPRYLFWRLWADWRSGVTVGFSRRTTGITNLSVPDYLARVITIPAFSEQERVAKLADSFSEAVTVIRACVASLTSLRTRLVVDLLSGEIEIPVSYDAVLAKAV